jgi:DNA-binding NarL/FixJ family response regulator
MIGSRLRLSPRELQITRCVFDDLTDTAIAAELGIGVSTVHSHFERLYHKLAIRSRTALVVRVFQEYVSQQPGPANGVRHLKAFVRGAP